MIAKQVKGCDFKGCLDYLLKREASKIIGGNLKGNDSESLSEEFKLAHQLNQKVKRYVYHASLSLPEREKLSEDKWKAIASDYLSGMGFTNNQYVIVGHNDTKHNHIHIVASRIKMDGKTVHDHWDFVKSEKLVRELEKKYGLEPTPGSKERLQRSPTTGETRLRRRTGETSVREFIQGAIDSVCGNTQTMPEFIAKVNDLGIETRITTKGNFRGISYKHEGIAFSGTHLGRGYTFPGLQKYRGVSYDSERDDVLLFLEKAEGRVTSFLDKTDTLLNETRRTDNSCDEGISMSGFLPWGSKAVGKTEKEDTGGSEVSFSSVSSDRPMSPVFPEGKPIQKWTPINNKILGQTDNLTQEVSIFVNVTCSPSASDCLLPTASCLQPPVANSSGGDDSGSSKPSECYELPPIDGRHKPLMESLQAIRASLEMEAQEALKNKKKELQIG